MVRLAALYAASLLREHWGVHLEACAGTSQCAGGKASPLQGLSLVQLADKDRARAVLKRSASQSKSLLSKESDAALARHFRSHFIDFNNIGSALMGGLGAFTKVIPFFTSDSDFGLPQMNQGFGAMGEELFEVILSMLPSDQVQEFGQFSDMFNKIFEDLPTAIPELTDLISNFHDTGDQADLINAFNKVLDLVGVEVADKFPAASGLEVANFMGALEDLFGALGDGGAEMELGDAESAIKAIVEGLRLATDDLSPPDQVSDGEYDSIMGQLDSGIGSFFSLIGDYKKHIEESEVCWKSEDTVLRQKIQPAKCPDNYEFDGHHWCVAVEAVNESASLLQWGSNSQSGCSTTADCHYAGCDQPDHVTCWQGTCYTGTHDSRCENQLPLHDLGDGGWCYEGRRDISCPPRLSTPPSANGPSSTTNPKPHRVVTPECDAEGEYPEQQGAWCFKACPHGSKPTGKNKRRCKAACVGDYPFSDSMAPLLCGKTADAMQQAVQTMVASSMQTLFGAIVGGLTMVGLPGTLSSLTEMGKTFAHPKCPIGAELLELKARSLSQASDASFARHIRSHFMDIDNIGAALMGGLGAFTKVIPFFTSNSDFGLPQMNQGFGAMGEELFDVILSMLPSDQVQEFGQFSDMFNKIFEDLPTAIPELTDLISNFHDTGDQADLINAFNKVLDLVGVEVADKFPADSGLEVANFMGALEDLFGALGDGGAEMELGDAESAIKAIVEGLRLATDDLSPPDQVSDGEYDSIMGQLDSGIGSFFNLIGDYKKHIEESEVCWKSEDTVLRQKIQPAKCPDNYEFDGHHWCVAVEAVNESTSLLQWGSNSQSSCSTTADCHYAGCDQPDHVTCWQGTCYTGTHDSRCENQLPLHDLGDGGWCYEGRRDISCPPRSSTPPSANGPSSTTNSKPHRVVTPECDAEGEYPEQQGAWCFKACPHGSKPTGKNKRRCKAACVGDYPLSDSMAPLLCGKTADAMQKAVQKMVGQSMQTFFGAIVGGFTLVGLPGTLSSLTEMGKSFAHPKCPFGEQL